MSDGTRPIEWLQLVATIFIGPAIQVWMQKYFFRYDERMKKLEKKANQTEEEKTKEKMETVKEFAENVTKALVEEAKKNKKIKEKETKNFKDKSCSNCWKLYEETWPDEKKSEDESERQN
jgi:hypothetical protein